MEMKHILSGMRPTGSLHLGHYVGALKQWITLQDDYHCFFMIADWHALMSEYENTENLGEYCVEIAADWLSVGIDPEKSCVFLQSYVPGHLELQMILSVLTPLSWLERNPTYKEQLRELTTRHLTTYGFLGYPVLQAADILLYKSFAVPIGMDQLPHLEITREIVRKFHSLYKEEILIEPKPIISEVPKLLGLDNRKMSKSYDNYIALKDNEETIAKKIMKMITDKSRIKKTDPGHPDICNVFSYYRAFAPGKIDEVKDYCENATLGCTDCKKNLAAILCAFLAPIQEKRAVLKKDTVIDIIKEGTKKANEVSNVTISEVKKVLGMVTL